MIEKIGHYSLTGQVSIFDEEAMTALELAGRTAAKVNECVDAINKHNVETDRTLKEFNDSLEVKVEQTVESYVNDGLFDEAIEEHLGEVETKLDNLINNTPEGSTTMDVEVIDIRLDAEGKTHGSAGEAVREQVRSLAKGTNKPNLINPKTLSTGYLQTTGDLHPSHQSGTFQRWEYTSDLIPVTSGIPYTFSFKHNNKVALWYAIATYDANGVFISRPYVYEANTSDYARSFTFPEDVVYVRVSYRSYMTALVKFEQSAYASQIPTKTGSNNLIDDHPLQFDGYIVDNGSIFPQTDDGYVEGEPSMKEKYSTFIPVTAGEKYTLYHFAEKHAWCVVGVYSADGNALARLSASNNKNEFTIPDGAVAIMVCARTHYLKDLALFKLASPMTADQRVYENYITLNSVGGEQTVFGDNVKAINHRGFNSEAPENTLSAFRLSASRGFKYVECDVRSTSDGVPVLLHDATVDRTSNGTGDITSLTFSAVRDLDFGNGEKIPSYEEFIALCKALGLHAYVEIKHVNVDFIRQLVGITRMYGMTDNVSYISFDLTALTYVRRYDGLARVGYILETLTSTNVTDLKALGGDIFFDLSASSVNDSLITLAVEANIPVEVWTVNNETALLMLNPYITGVTSDSLHAGAVMYKTTPSGTMTPIPSNLPTRTGFINFSIDGVYLIAEEGMTWTQWCASEYNTTPFEANTLTLKVTCEASDEWNDLYSKHTVCKNNGSTAVYGNEKLINGYEYKTKIG